MEHCKGESSVGGWAVMPRGREVTNLSENVRAEAPPEKVAFQPKHGGGERGSHADVWVKDAPGGGTGRW